MEEVLIPLTINLTVTCNSKFDSKFIELRVKNGLLSASDLHFAIDKAESISVVKEDGESFILR